MRVFFCFCFGMREIVQSGSLGPSCETISLVWDHGREVRRRAIQAAASAVATKAQVPGSGTFPAGRAGVGSGALAHVGHGVAGALCATRLLAAQSTAPNNSFSNIIRPPEIS